MPLMDTYIGDRHSNDPAFLQQEQAKAQAQAEDQRLRSNIQWGIVRGMFLYFVLMLPIALIGGIIVGAIASAR